MIAPIALVSPAMAVGSNFYRPIAEAFQTKGWDVKLLPRRGFELGDARASKDNDWSYGDELETMAEAVRAARAENPLRPVVVVGHSLGGQLGAGLQLGEDPADGLVVIGTSLPHYGHFGIRSIGLYAMAHSIRPITAIRGFVPKPLFGAPGAKTLMREWADMITHARMPFDVPHRVTRPTLAIRLERDTYSVTEASKHFEEVMFEPEALTVWTYRRRETPEGGTTHHVHCMRKPERMVDEIVDWWAKVSVTV